MRSGAQITRTPREWKDHQAEERRRALAAFLRLCRDARARGEEWVGWIDAGCPTLTADEYAERGGQHAPGGSSGPERSSAQGVL